MSSAGSAEDIVVEGDPGIGKSSLLSRIASLAPIVDARLTTCELAPGVGTLDSRRRFAHTRVIAASVAPTLFAVNHDGNDVVSVLIAEYAVDLCSVLVAIAIQNGNYFLLRAGIERSLSRGRPVGSGEGAGSEAGAVVVARAGSIGGVVGARNGAPFIHPSRVAAGLFAAA